MSHRAVRWRQMFWRERRTSSTSLFSRNDWCQRRNGGGVKILNCQEKGKQVAEWPVHLCTVIGPRKVLVPIRSLDNHWSPKCLCGMYYVSWHKRSTGSGVGNNSWATALGGNKFQCAEIFEMKRWVACSAAFYACMVILTTVVTGNIPGKRQPKPD